MDAHLEHPAVARFRSGLNCAQAVFTEFAPDLGLDDATACKIASGFGGGLAHTDNLCGVVSAGVLAIGLKLGATRGSDRYSKQLTYRVIQSFIKDFLELHGSVQCTKLLGHDLSDEMQFQAAISAAAPHNICPKYIVTAIELVRQVLESGGGLASLRTD